MSSRLKKILLLALAAVLLAGVAVMQRSLNRDRDRLGLTRMEPLTNAPPVLAFTTMALGGFRGLISNMLWIRASDLQEQDKFFEAAQLADWITKLEPHFAQVWVHQAWNMAYNISVKFKDYPDRWRWVQHGIELLRDDGLHYNPDDILIHRELAWFFQHKMGAHTDDASMYYKQQWANAMAEVFAKKAANFDELIRPQNEDQTNRTRLLREKYKMDPEFMKKVHQQYGPLEWRLPEAHAIYWAALGLERARQHPERAKREDLIMLHRVVYQSMLMTFQRGRLVANPFIKQFEIGPNLEIIPNVNKVYLQAMKDEPENADHISIAHRNFLRDAVYFLYLHDRAADANEWFRTLATRYPNKTILDNDPNSFPARLTLDQYAVGRVQEDVNDFNRDKTQSAIEGLVINSYTSLILEQDNQAAGYRRLAQKVWESYQSQVPPERMAALSLLPFEEIDRKVRDQILDTQEGWPPDVRAALRVKLGMPREESPPAAPSS